jgi:hypothetical protein
VDGPRRARRTLQSQFPRAILPEQTSVADIAEAAIAGSDDLSHHVDFDFWWTMRAEGGVLSVAEMGCVSHSMMF